MPKHKQVRDATLARLCAARKAAGLTQQQAADAMNMLRVTLTNIETGHRKLKALEAAGFCRLYGVTPNWLLGFCRDGDG